MNLNPEQQAAATTDASRALVVANPGSGKTATYIARIRHLIATGARPDSIVAITFMNAAAAEISKRIDQQMLNVRVSFEADVAARVIKEGSIKSETMPLRLGYIGTLHGFMLRLLQKHGHNIGLPPKLTVIDDAEREALVERCVKRLNFRGSLKLVDAAIEMGAEYYRTPGQLKRTDPAQLVAYEFYFQLFTNGSLTYDSILELGLLLVQMPNVKAAIKCYDHLLVDEFQDSGALDVKIYDALPVNTRFMVGDPDQAIYGFRGGCQAEIMMESENPDTKVFTLAVNYRSGSAICDVANKLIAHNAKRLPKQIECGVEWAGRFDTEVFKTGRHELDTVAAMCEQNITVGGVAPGEIAVLCRTNALCQEFQAALKARGLEVHGRLKQDLPPDWATARAFVSLLANPDNDAMAMKFLRLRFEAKRAEQMQTEALNEFQSINERWLHIGTVMAADVTTAMVQAGLGQESVARVGALAALLEPESTATDVMLAMVQKEAAVEETGRGIVVTTMHAAKGREFDVVYLPGWDHGLFPSRMNVDTEEERRLAFVGITRARKACFVSRAERRMQRFGMPPLLEEMSPGKFFTEVA